MRVVRFPAQAEWPELCQRPYFDSKELEGKVQQIIDEVKLDGDVALKKFASLFDGVELNDLLVSEQELQQSVSGVDDELKAAISIAAYNIRSFHESQREVEHRVETAVGVTCWRKSVAIEKVGLYIPGGTAPLFSTLLMLAIPALIAGCTEIVLCTPPGKDGNVHPAILYCAQLLGLSKIYKVGGAQAIAAMTYGTENIPACYKIFGPGNQYVTTAKMLINKTGVAIDMPAGPSELAVVVDESSNAAYVAADLLSQAEHGVDSQVVLVATDEEKIGKVKDEVEQQLAALPRKDIAAQALEHSFVVLMENKEVAMDFVNEYAPEHLILATDDAENLAGKVINAGSVFLGHFTPESAGDYASGTNHTLPTGGFAKAYSGVSLDSFVKKITFQKIDEQGIKNIGPAIEKMAAAEQLDAHKHAVTLRLKDV